VVKIGKEKLGKRTEFDPQSGCIEWQGATTTHGYGQLSMNGEIFYTHRLSYEIYKGEIEDGLQINHRCHNECCVNPEHLYMGTQQENVRDAVVEGEYVSNFGIGDEHFNSKLCEDDVIELRKLYSTGDYTYEELGRKFNVNENTVGEAIRGDTWSHVTMEANQ